MKRITPKILVIFSIVLSLSILPMVSYADHDRAVATGHYENESTTATSGGEGRFRDPDYSEDPVQPENTNSTTQGTFWGNVSNSTREKFANMSDIPLPNAGNFILAGQDATGSLSTASLVDKMDKSIGGGLVSMLKILYQIGIMIAVCVFAFMGVQFVMSSPQQKAQLKASLFPYFVGLLLFVAGVPIATFIINIFLQLL